MTNKWFLKKEQAAEDYRKKLKKFEETEELILEEKQRFYSAIEETAEKMRYVFMKQDNTNEHRLKDAYTQIERAQDEGYQLMKEATRRIEEDIEHLQAEYKKQVALYEEEEWADKQRREHSNA